LLDHCAERAAGLGLHVLRTRCSDLTQDFAFGVVRNLVETRLLRADGAERAKLMQGPASLAGPVLGRGDASDEFGVIHGLYWLTVNLAESGPLAILIDDVHWSDELSLRFLIYLAERLADIPVALIAVVRSGDAGAESQLMGHLWAAVSSPPICPDPLSEGAVQALLASTCPGIDVDASVTQAVMRETGGNPFLLMAVADEMRENRYSPLTVPESVRRDVGRGLGRLSAACRDIAKVASVIGDDAALYDAVRLAGLMPDQGLPAAEGLVKAGILISGQPIRFAHQLVRRAIYSLLAPAERLYLHGASAELLTYKKAQPEVIADHLLESGPTHEAWASAVLHRAGQAASRRGATATAVRYLRRAVDIAYAVEPSARMLIDLGLAEAAAGEPTSLDRFEDALKLVTDSAERADALYSLGQTLFTFGRYADAGAAFRRGTEPFEGGDEQVRMRFEGAAWAAEFHIAPALPASMSAADGDGPGDRAVLAVMSLHHALTVPPATAAGELAIRALGGGALLCEQTSLGPGVSLATVALLHAGRLREAQDAADAAVRDACQRGARLAYAEASIVRSLVGYARGRVDDAAADAQFAVDAVPPGENAHTRTALATLANCMMERGQLAEAGDVMKRAVRELTAPATPVIDAYVHVTRGRLHLLGRDLGSARRDLEAAQALIGHLGPVNPSALPWRSLAGVIAHRCGEDERARELIDEEVRLAALFDVPVALGVALRRRALTKTGDEACQTLQEAIAVLDGTDATLQLARAQAGLGRARRLTGQRARARTHLAIGLDLAHRCGALALETQLREELSVAGARPRRPAVTGIESLTATEVLVARLAAQDMSNREIADQCFITRNTVAWHLRNVYRKLQIESRAQLPALSATDVRPPGTE
jgi:DNA-binding CsgD family transcriptional regulator